MATGNISGVQVNLITSVGGVSIASITSLGGVDVTSIGSWPGGNTGPRRLIDPASVTINTQVYPATPGGQDLWYLILGATIDSAINASNVFYKGYVEKSMDGRRWNPARVILFDFALDEKSGMPIYQTMSSLNIDSMMLNGGYQGQYFRLVGYPIYGDYTTYFTLTVNAGTGIAVPPSFLSLVEYYQGNLL